MSHCFLQSIGTAVPQHTISQAEAIGLTQDLCSESERDDRLISTIYRKSTIQRRYTCLPYETARSFRRAPAEVSSGPPHTSIGTTANVSVPSRVEPTTEQRMHWYEQHAFPLAHTAARRALTQAAISPSAITHLITVSCTGFYSPGVDVQLIEHLPLSASTERVHVGFMGCHGAINGLRAAQSICQANPAANVLLCAVELCSLHYKFEMRSDRFMGNILFADGAAATVLRGSSGRRQQRANQAEMGLDLVATGSYLVPDSRDAMSWRVGDHGFAMTLSSKIPDIIGRSLRSWLSSWLLKRGYSIEAIQNWVVHPGGPRILDAVEASLQLTPDRLQHSRTILRDYGNMSSPTVLFILKEALNGPTAAGPTVMLGFGPGLTCEIALFA